MKPRSIVSSLLVGISLLAAPAAWSGCAASGSNSGSGGAGGGARAASSSSSASGAGGSMGCGAGVVACGQSCVDIKNDPMNCGACAKACAAGEVCSQGACALTCSGGATKCGNACVDTQHDPMNCGACAKACAAGEVCSQGACALTCSGGATKCGSTCVDTQNDPMNCGACAKACPVDQVCVSGACALTCVGGTTKCANLCTNTSFDPMNCGACGKVCVGGMNATAVCVSGACAEVCVAPFADCNNSIADGCETNTSNSAANCGACGKACAVGQACMNGVCSAAGGACQAGGVLVSTAPSGTMLVCDSPNNSVCEQDAETLCPVGWGLCSWRQYQNRNAGWAFAVDQPTQKVVIGEIYCRVSGGAGHFTVPDSNNTPVTLGGAAAFNCYYGSSRASCTSNYGCNEQFAMALCCAPTPSCGNGVVDSVEEECDDGNVDETDNCLNSCSWRVPASHGQTGTNCN